MNDGTALIDNPIAIQNKIDIPPGKFESPKSIGENTQLKTFYDAFLNIPERIDPEHQNQLGHQMATFLTDRGYINQIKTWNNSWGYQYDSSDKSISISQYQMPPEMYDKYVIQLGIDASTGQSLYPKPEEMDQYRFLHEVGHAFQDYSIDQEGSSRWYDKAIAGELDSPYAILLGYCYKIRTENPNRGLTTWGGQADYDGITNTESRNATRAIDDVNELITMYIWHPQYFETYMDYLAQELPGYGVENLNQDKLMPLTHDKKDSVRQLVYEYVGNIKQTVTP